MTIVAYRDGVIASDSLLLQGGEVRCGEVRKIGRAANGGVAGASGSFMECHRFLSWVEGGFSASFHAGDPEAFSAILVQPDGTINIVSPDGNLCPVNAPFKAIGCGYQVALGAMYMGASAVEAVRAAIELDPFCGGAVATLELEDKQICLPMGR